MPVSICMGGSRPCASPTAAMSPPTLSSPVIANQPASAATPAMKTPLIVSLPAVNRPSALTDRIAPASVC